MMIELTPKMASAAQRIVIKQITLYFLLKPTKE